jgi:biopolymer transport protein ExbB/TolQ
MDVLHGGILLAQIVLGLYSLTSVAVIIERIVSLRKIATLEERDFPRLRAATKGGKRSELNGDSPTALALDEGLRLDRLSERQFTEAVGRGISAQVIRFQKRLSLLATIASTAPYVGLFGTVLGILEAFRRIAATGETGAAVVANGISEALITTALGLGVAIPAVIAYNYFNRRVEEFSLTVENHALELTTRLFSEVETTP